MGTWLGTFKTCSAIMGSKHLNRTKSHQIHWLCFPLGKTLKVLHLQSCVCVCDTHTPTPPPFLFLSYQSRGKPGCRQRTGDSTARQELRDFPICLAMVVLGMLPDNLVWVGPSGMQWSEAWLFGKLLAKGMLHKGYPLAVGVWRLL